MGGFPFGRRSATLLLAMGEPPRTTVDPPQTLFGALRHLGPGIVLASSIVGSGELIATTSTGAQAGFLLLWLIIIGCVIKVAAQVEIGRATLAWGRTPLDAFDRVPGPRLAGRTDRRPRWRLGAWLRPAPPGADDLPRGCLGRSGVYSGPGRSDLGDTRRQLTPPAAFGFVGSRPGSPRYPAIVRGRASSRFGRASSSSVSLPFSSGPPPAAGHRVVVAPGAP
jgi:hypothetical protein